MGRWGGILGLQNGVVLAPMGPDITGPELVAAVANAGGLGLMRAPSEVFFTTFFPHRHSHLLRVSNEFCSNCLESSRIRSRAWTLPSLPLVAP